MHDAGLVVHDCNVEIIMRTEVGRLECPYGGSEHRQVFLEHCTDEKNVLQLFPPATGFVAVSASEKEHSGSNGC